MARLKKGIVKKLRMYVRFQFSSEGASPAAVIDVVTALGFRPVMGAYDFYYEVGGPGGHYRQILERLHDELRGMRVQYTVTTKKE